MDLAITQRPCIVLRKGSRVITIPSNSNQIGIASGTLRLKSSIVDTDIEFGVPIASEFSVELFNIEEDLRGWEIEVSLKDTTQPVPIYTALFTGVIDSSKTDNIGHTRQIVAYDWIYYHRDDNVASWWNNYWQPATGYSIKTVRNAFLQYLGFTTPTKSYVNDTDSIISWSSDDLPIMSTITVGQVLKMLCEMQGTFPFIDPFGNLDFATLDDTYTVDITGQYETGNSTWEDFTTDTITGVSLYSSSEDLLTSVGTVDNVYNIAGNIWLMHLEDYYHDNVITVLTNLLNFIDDIQYKPCNIKMIKSNINLYLGQRVLTDRGYTYVMSNELSGVCFVEQTIQGISSASKLPKEVSDANDTMVQENKLSKTYSEINQLKDRIVLKVDASGKIVQAELSADPSTGSTFSIDADYISFVANTTIDLKTGKIGIESDNFSIDKTTGNVTINGSVTCNDGKISLYNSDYSYTAEIVTDLEEFVTNGYDYNVNTGLIEETSGGAVAYPVIKFNQANPLVINNGVDIVGDLTVTNGDISAFRHNVTAKKAVIQDSVMTTELFATTDVKSNLYKLYTRYNNTDYEKNFIQGERNQNYIGWTMYGFKDTTYFQSKYGLPADFMLTGSLWMTSYLTLNNQTANTVAIFDSSKRVVSSTVTPTELSYLSGATSNVQEQIDTTPVSMNGNPIAITDAANIPCESLTMTIEPIQSGSGTPSIDNVRPITGLTEANAMTHGVNMWDEETRNGYYLVENGRFYPDSSQLCSKNLIPVLPNTTYRLVGVNDTIVFCNASGAYISGVRNTNVFTTPSNCYYIAFNFGSTYGGTYNHDVSVNYPQSYTEYHPYQKNTATISFGGDTVYGGTVDFNTGILTLTWANINITSGVSRYTDHLFYKFIDNGIRYTFSSDGLKCDKFATHNERTEDRVIVDFQARLEFWTVNAFSSVADFMAYCGNSIQAVYKLATPQTVQLTPTQLTLLKGTNIVSANGSTIRLSYQKDNKIGDVKQWVKDNLPKEYYSLSEQLTNQVWVDGKPIYQKTIFFAGGSSGGLYNIPHNITNLDKVIYLEGFFADSSGDNPHMILPRIGTDGYNIGIKSINNTYVAMAFNTVWGSRLINVYITMRYTKTS